VHRITWEMIRFDAKSIVLEKSFTKTRRRRVIPMGDALLAWLKPHASKGRLYEGTLAAFESRMHAAWPAIADRKGKILVHKKRNGLRHSYGTYRFALLQDENKVSAEMGNSPSELREHYAEIALPGDAEKWFNVKPR
jgi:integrase